MIGAIGSQFGGSSLSSLFWIIGWLVFGPVALVAPLLRPVHLREERRNTWLAVVITFAPFLYAAIGWTLA